METPKTPAPKCLFYAYTAAAIKTIQRAKQDAANAGVPYDSRFDELPKQIRFATYAVPQIGDELKTNLEDREVTVKVLKRTFVFMDAEENPENVAIRFDVEEVA